MVATIKKKKKIEELNWCGSEQKFRKIKKDLHPVMGEQKVKNKKKKKKMCNLLLKHITYCIIC